MRSKNSLGLKAAFVLALTLALIIPGSTAMAIKGTPSLDNHQTQPSTPAVSRDTTIIKTVEPTVSAPSSNDKGNTTNAPPVISNEYPLNGATNVPITLSMLTVFIGDPENDSFMWTIDTSPYIGSSGNFSWYSDTMFCIVSGLHYNTTYYWVVDASDNGSGHNTTVMYSFTTRPMNFTRGDANSDGVIDAADVVFLINYLYKYGPAPNPLWLGDFNWDGSVNVGDIVALTNYLYRSSSNSSGNATGPGLILGGSSDEIADASLPDSPSLAGPTGNNGSQSNLTRGDVNIDGVINVADVVYLVNYLYKKGSAPNPLWLGDFNFDGTVNVGDIVALAKYLYGTSAPPGSPSFIPGDANMDGAITAADLYFLNNYLYHGGPEPDPFAAGDANSDGAVNVGDIIYLIDYLFG
jgi:hypothetical protein